MGWALRWRQRFRERSSAALVRDDEQVFVAVACRASTRAPVGARHEVKELPIACCGTLRFLGQARIDFHYRSERSFETLEVLLAAPSLLHVLLTSHLQRFHPVAEQLPHVSLASPEYWRERAGRRRRRVGREHAEQVRREPL